MSPSKSNLPSRIFVDASHTLPSGLNGGVQRVVRNLCKYIPRLANTHTKVVVGRGAGFDGVDVEQELKSRRSVHEIRSNVLNHMPDSYVRSASLLCKLLPVPVMRRWLLPLPGHQGIFKLPLMCYERLTVKQPERGKVEPGAGDVLVIPDAYWAHSEVWPAIRQAQARGAYIVSVVYDLIPLTHPHFVAEGAPESFKEYLHEIAIHSDMIVAISDTVRAEVAEMLPQYWPNEDLCRDIRCFDLGAQFQQKSGFVRPEIKRVFSEDGLDNPYLMVATFDPRKNHAYLLDAFEKIWEKSPDQKLCFVGRVGWLSEDLIERIWSHPRFCTHLFALHDVSDSELTYCYQKARAICFPSITEGFGLPIIEALWYGRQVFASDTAIHREVGKDECTYCDLQDPGDLANKILDWESQIGRESPCREATVRPIGWEQSSKLLLDHFLDGYAKRLKNSRRAAA